ncbi:DUF4062 domain-containing protein [Leptospira sp. 201903071]|uniref:DUF4062 domain-containing protein n=1 Tax=Leptospira ainazelensis TaxID=2810034 RepID=UPI0019637254|nr:DUF4062 domain-containing protein [Leptospira ainazelensis]MBM9500278.1 DUF4062 domain-containing protein [Leptospira ainazelensis]
MYFRPRIFLSSVLSLINVRDKIAEILETSGADVMRYENNLTPSSTPATYRQDVIESDFIIFIIDKSYGTLTETGKSGTHEEWELAVQAEIPKHVYIKKTNKLEDPLKVFLEKEITAKYVSFFYYKNDQELLRQVRSRIFTVAREIAIRKLDPKYLPSNKIRTLVHEYDYQKALPIIRGMEELLKYQARGLVDFLETTILTSYISRWEMQFESDNKHYFINDELNRTLNYLIEDFNKFHDLHSKCYTSIGLSKELNLSSIQTVIDYRLLKVNVAVDQKRLNKLLKEFLKWHSIFKSDVFEAKKQFDTIG